MQAIHDSVADAVRSGSIALTGSERDYDALIERIAGARFVLIGEASHGTHEFYRERAQITKRLIREQGFAAVAVEADWPDAYLVNRYVHTEALREERLERAIGVIYRPETERVSHYFEARLPDQFNAVIHVDETRALEPLERTTAWSGGEPPETYPTGI